MAGQPPEPSFQPSGQDQALTQGRPAWQAPPYNQPPAAASGGQQGYGASSYPSQDQAYPGQDQTYTSVGQGQDYQAYQGYQPPGYGAQQPGQQPGQGAGAAPPQWQGIAGGQPGSPRAKSRTRPPGEKGFVGSLFDYSFNSMITPKLVKGLYILATVMTLFGLLLIYGFGRALGHSVGAGLIELVIFGVPFALLSLGISRLMLEAIVILFQIHGELKKIREAGEKQG
jgi:hypothetical protein